MSEENARYENKIQALQIAVIIIFVIIFSRLWLLQVMRGSENYATSSSMSQRRIPLPAPRGVIYDRNGKTLVTSRILPKPQEIDCLSFLILLLPT